MKSFSEIFERLFIQWKVSDAEFHSAVVQALIECFHIQSELPIDTRMVLALKYLFVNLNPSFDFECFAHMYLKDEEDRKSVLIALVNGIYYLDIDLFTLVAQYQVENLEYFLFQIIAENVSPTSIETIITDLTFSQQMKLLYIAHQFYREGSYALLKVFRKKSINHAAMTQLLRGLGRKYYSLNLFLKLINNGHTTLNQILYKLEDYAVDQVKEIKNVLEALIPFLVTNLPSVNSNENIQETFQSFFANYELGNYIELFQLFGLEGHVPNLPLQKEWGIDNTILEKLKALLNYFSSRSFSTILDAHLHSYIKFLRGLINQLYALSFDREKYIKPLSQLNIGIPTLNRKLEDFAGVASTLRCLNNLVETLNQKLSNKIHLKDYPIFIFDQSNDGIFLVNKRYIDTLNQTYNSSIIHLSKKDILQIASQLEIESLINTSELGNFGYGGARNCVFLLTPVLTDLFKNKIPAQDLIDIDSRTVKKVFQRYIHEESSKNRHLIYMIEDDVEITEANIFAYLLQSVDYNDYFSMSGRLYGRLTSLGTGYMTLNNLLYHPQNTFSQNIWWNFSCFFGPMVEYFGYPKLCINLPFGAEEFLMDTHEEYVWFGQASYHLAGSRLPRHVWPTHYIMGLEQILQNKLVYALQLSMVSSLIYYAEAVKNNEESQKSHDLGLSNRSIYHWNIDLKKQCISSFFDAIKILAEEKNRHAMQKCFWDHVIALFDLEDKEMFLTHQLLELIDCPIDDILLNFKAQVHLSLQEKKALYKIGQHYKTYQEDVRILLEYGLRLMQCIDFEDPLGFIEKVREEIEKERHLKFTEKPVTYGFYLMLKNLGGGLFNKKLNELLYSGESFSS